MRISLLKEEDKPKKLTFRDVEDEQLFVTKKGALFGKEDSNYAICITSEGGKLCFHQVKWAEHEPIARILDHIDGFEF